MSATLIIIFRFDIYNDIFRHFCLWKIIAAMLSKLQQQNWGKGAFKERIGKKMHFVFVFCHSSVVPLLAFSLFNYNYLFILHFCFNISFPFEILKKAYNLLAMRVGKYVFGVFWMQYEKEQVMSSLLTMNTILLFLPSFFLSFILLTFPLDSRQNLISTSSSRNNILFLSVWIGLQQAMLQYDTMLEFAIFFIKNIYKYLHNLKGKGWMRERMNGLLGLKSQYLHHSLSCEILTIVCSAWHKFFNTPFSSLLCFIVWSTRICYIHYWCFKLFGIW